MYGKGCPHSITKIFIQNGIKRENLVTPRVLHELEKVSIQSTKALQGVDNIMFGYFSQLNDLNGLSILEAFISFFSENLNISENEFQKYKKYAGKRGSKFEVSETIPQLLGFAFSDIYCLLLLHINLGIPLSQVKGIIIRSMMNGSAEFKYTPTGLITGITKFENPQRELDKIMKILKHFIPQKVSAHKYGEPSCPFTLSQEIDIWLETVIKYLLETLIPEIQKRYRGRCKNFEEEFFSGNYTKTIPESMGQ